MHNYLLLRNQSWIKIWILPYGFYLTLKQGGDYYMHSEPTHLYQSEDVLHLLYAKGWYMKMYGLNWFHNLWNTEYDRKFLGTVHPRTA